jgi:hypothetical protein
MRVLFFTKLLTLPPFAGLVVELAARGVDVTVATPSNERARDVPEALLSSPGVRFERYDEFADEEPARAVELLRRARDYCWYLGPEHRVATFNRRRALDRFAEVALARSRAPKTWPDPLVQLDPDVQAGLEGLLGELEARLEPEPAIVELIAERRPDVVLVTPLVRPRLHQTEVVKAARALGIPSGFLVYSWDSLSNKGRLHVHPDRTYAWNDVHRREAVELHGVDAESVVVVGAAQWDPFFALRPSETRDELCARHGFDPARPIVVYLASTRNVCPDEPVVIERWLAAVRAAHEVNVLVRPHPGLKGWPKSWAARVPSAAGVAVSRARRKDAQSLFDDLCHADAVVALNTSAQIEASILEKPVYTFSAGELAPGQEGTLHFYNLLEGHGGVVRFGETLDEHVRQLERGLAGDVDRAAIRRFVEATVRPRGLDRPVSPILADEILTLGAGTAMAAGSRGYSRGRR